jgi:hypothetical protein
MSNILELDQQLTMWFHFYRDGKITVGSPESNTTSLFLFRLGTGYVGQHRQSYIGTQSVLFKLNLIVNVMPLCRFSANVLG